MCAQILKIFWFFGFILIVSCNKSKVKNELPFDEILYAEYKVSVFTGTIDLNDIVKPYLHWNGRPKIYLPLNILVIKKNGELTYFRHKYDNSLNNGYFKSVLGDTDIISFNGFIKKITYHNVHKAYYLPETRIYDGPYYYLSFTKQDSAISTHVYSLKDAPKSIQDFIGTIKIFLRNHEFNSCHEENLFDEENKRIYASDLESSPIKIKYDGQGSDYTPSIEEFRNKK
ncbi:MAG: hypothetical protein V1720_00340 [bacterium]